MKKEEKKYVLVLSAHTLFYSAGIMIAAGRIDYYQGWIYIGFYFFSFLSGLYLLRNKTDLFRERRKPGSGVPAWDRRLVNAYKILNGLTLFLSVLDRGRFGWSCEFPLILYIPSLALFALAWSFSLFAVSKNRFFSAVVRIQKDRGHTLVQEGPYRVIRHPGYTAWIISSLLGPIVLGSFLGLLPALASCAVIVIRTIREDEFLSGKLPGYRSYKKRVKYRLIPGIW